MNNLSADISFAYVNVRGFIGGNNGWALGMIDVAIRGILFKPFLVDVFLNTPLLGHKRGRGLWAYPKVGLIL